MNIDSVLSVLNVVLAIGMSLSNFILFLKTHRFFRWVRLMYAFDGLMVAAAQTYAAGPYGIDSTIIRGGVTLVVTTIFCSALLTLLGGNSCDYTNDTSVK